MAMVKPVIYQIAGYQNSGKTTVISALVRTLKERGMRIAVIKHHGHGGMPDVASEKDSGRHIKAGAIYSLVEGGGRLVLHAEKEKWSLEEQLTLLISQQPDVILIEGYKKADFEKTVLIRTKDDLPLLEELTNVASVLVMDSALEEGVNGYPVFVTGSAQGCEWIVNHIMKKRQ
ncbi:molybdopterin-guanine dinucleotide biosynthesis protein B [Bacillus massilinigeriensis]|uniref:molybdopterin-guanine dinucleotide biosynthesis protein B n=1 Tax=Bacillus mediterraneensis TaxID=1805474 RepID=UPI001F29EC5E|nr:molybdopterin-guanine dinucleotide biosynthesis protein B [Bacillus mediterraneensis]